MSDRLPHSSGIYKITCIPTGKIYIGSSKDLHARWNSHKNDLENNRHGNSYLQNAWNKYGCDSFIIEIVEFVMSFALIDREQYWLDKLKPFKRDIGFNIAKHADTPTRTREVNEKISKSHIGIKPSTETRIKQSLARVGKRSPNLGKKFSEEHCKNIGLAKLGQHWELPPRSPEHAAKLSDAKSKNYIVTSPDGIEYKIRNLARFCREHNLNSGHMASIARGSKDNYKGWRCRFD